MAALGCKLWILIRFLLLFNQKQYKKLIWNIPFIKHNRPSPKVLKLNTFAQILVHNILNIRLLLKYRLKKCHISSRLLQNAQILIISLLSSLINKYSQGLICYRICFKRAFMILVFFILLKISICWFLIIINYGVLFCLIWLYLLAIEFRNVMLEIVLEIIVYIFVFFLE